MPRLALRPEESPPDPSHTLEQHILAGFPPDLALDLVLNELVVRAAETTRASAAALALVRGNENENEMVCRAATGHLAPGLGVPLKPRDGLSGACLQTRQPQLSVDAERDPRVDPATSRRLGIRSILAVPVFETNNETNNGFDIDRNTKFAGVLEVFSTSPAAFSTTDQKLLEAFAKECARVRQAALELTQRRPVGIVPAEFISPALVPLDFPAEATPPEVTPPPNFAASPLSIHRFPYEGWALALGILTIVAAIALSLLIGSRIGWLRPSPSASSHAEPPAAAQSCVGTAASGCPPEQTSAPAAASPQAIQSVPEQTPLEKRPADKTPSEKAPTTASGKSSRSSSAPPAAAAGELVIYEKGKVIFRTKPTPGRQITDAATETTSSVSTKADPPTSVWLDPEQAEARLQRRTEPQYPASALAAHRTGDVVLEVLVAEDGSVSHVRLLKGDPVLAAAAAEAVRTWRYRPYLQHDHPSQFQTDVTLTFALPD